MGYYTDVTTDSIDDYCRDEAEKSEIQERQEKRVFEVSIESDISDFCICVARLRNKLHLATAEFDCGKYIFVVRNWKVAGFLDYLASFEIKVKSRKRILKQFLFIKRKVPAEQYIIRSSYNHSKKRGEAYICLGKKFNDNKIIFDEKIVKTIIFTLKKCFLNSLDSKTIKIKSG